MRNSLLSNLLIGMAVLFALLAGVFLVVGEGIITPGYAQLEKEQAATSIRRVVNVLDLELDHLERIVIDWAFWDETYEYARKPAAAYEKANLLDNVYSTLDINLLAILDLEGRFLWVKALDSRTYQPLAIAEFAGPGLAGSPLLKLAHPQRPLAEQRVNGIFSTSAGPMLCSVHPILDSNMHGPSRGFFMMGRLLTTEFIEQLARQTETHLAFTALHAGGLPAGTINPRRLPAAGEIEVLVAGQQLEAFTTIAGVDNLPALLVRIILPRAIHAYGQENLRLAFGLFGFGMVISMVLATLLLRRTVTTPVRRLTEAVLATGSSERHAIPVDEIAGAREIRVLGQEFSRLVQSLAEKNAYLGDLNRHLIRDAEKLKHAERRLMQLDQLKNEFISTAAHELRTPVASIMGYTELLADEEPFGHFSEAQKQDFLREIYENCEGLTRIVDSILDVSRIESGQPLPLYKDDVDLAALLGRVIGRFRLQAGRHELQLVVPAGLPPVELDPQRITQVMENLLSNAIKYSPGGGPVTVTVTREAARCRIAVADRGIGMTTEQLARIFDKFYRADGSNTAVRGLGLGMSIVRQIVLEHEGSIQVESEYGKGTTVLLELPFRATTTPADGQPAGRE